MRKGKKNQFIVLLSVCFVLNSLSITDVWAQLVYHGSPLDFMSPVPMKNVSKNEGKIVWIGSAIFASPDRRVALAYTAKRWPDRSYSFEVPLARKVSLKEPLLLKLYGGLSQEDALEKLYGPKRGPGANGYLYCMDQKEFRREQGLGEMEMVSRTRLQLTRAIQCPFGKMRVHRRAEIDQAVLDGSILIQWARNTPSSSD